MRVMKETDITIVLIEPRRIRNCSRVDFPESSEAMIAAWDEPNPGKREQIGEMRIVAIVGLMIWDFGMWSFSIFCFGKTVFDFMEWVRVEVAKSPVRSGRRGWVMLRFRALSPRKPESMKIMIAFIFEFFSL